MNVNISFERSLAPGNNICTKETAKRGKKMKSREKDDFLSFQGCLSLWSSKSERNNFHEHLGVLYRESVSQCMKNVQLTLVYSFATVLSDSLLRGEVEISFSGLYLAQNPSLVLNCFCLCFPVPAGDKLSNPSGSPLTDSVFKSWTTFKWSLYKFSF